MAIERRVTNHSRQSGRVSRLNTTFGADDMRWASEKVNHKYCQRCGIVTCVYSATMRFEEA